VGYSGSPLQCFQREKFHKGRRLNQIYLTEDGSENQGFAKTEKKHVGSEYTMVSTNDDFLVCNLIFRGIEKIENSRTFCYDIYIFYQVFIPHPF
jgi:hypothetical protein